MYDKDHKQTIKSYTLVLIWLERHEQYNQDEYCKRLDFSAVSTSNSNSAQLANKLFKLQVL